MSKIYLKRVGFHLLPTDQESLIALKKLPLDKPLSCEVKQTRNYQFHKKFFALLDIGYDNTQKFGNCSKKTYRAFITVLAGYGKLVKSEYGMTPEPESISFANMTQDDFEELYKDALSTICIDIGSTSDEIEQNLINFM